MNLSIVNGRLIDPAGGLDIPAGPQSAVHVSQGRVLAIGAAPLGFVAERVIDAAGCGVAPGLLDLAARLREPGYEYKASLESEMQAAMAGGITGLACPPDTEPTLDEPGLIEMLKHRARGIDGSRLFPVGSLTTGLGGETITEMAELAEAGCVGFSQALQPIHDTQVLMRAMQYARTYGFTVWLHPQDSYLAANGVAHDGEVAARLGLRPIPAAAETVALATMLRLARETGARLHICRLSAAESVDMIAAAKTQGLPVTCDIAANHLHLTEYDIGFFDANSHLHPPLRSQRDKDALRQGLADGTIDAVCSDHTPVDEDAKLLPFGEAEAGATGLELLLPLTLKWADEQGLSLSDAIAGITSKPAAILGLKSGHLGLQAAADVCIFDPAQYWKIEPRALKSQGKNTPFNGMELAGKVRYTMLDGNIIYKS